jgi:hypothetical protein
MGSPKAVSEGWILVALRGRYIDPQVAILHAIIRTCCATTKMPKPPYSEFLSAALGGRSPPWPYDDSSDIERLLQLAREHGVLALIHQHKDAGWPAKLLSMLRTESIEYCMWELRHHQLLAPVLAALSDAGVEPLILKGTALAYLLWHEPTLRVRGDTDILVKEGHREKTAMLLEALGFVREKSISGELVAYQASFSKHLPDGGKHTIDLHWKISNSEVLNRLFSHQELAESSVDIQRLCPSARGLSLPHSMLLACMHMASHKQNPYYFGGKPVGDSERLIWLADIALLAASMNPQELERTAMMASGKGLVSICAHATERAGSLLGVAQCSSFSSALMERVPSDREIAYRYVTSRKHIQQWLDFIALADSRKRVRFLREVLFPSGEYLRYRYPDKAHWATPVLHSYRLWNGVRRTVVSLFQVNSTHASKL